MKLVDCACFLYVTFTFLSVYKKGIFFFILVSDCHGRGYAKALEHVGNVNKRGNEIILERSCCNGKGTHNAQLEYGNVLYVCSDNS